MNNGARRGWCVVVLGLLLGAGTRGAAKAQHVQTQAPSQAPTPPVPAEAPPEVRVALSQPTLQGQGGLRFLGLRVYEARLWVPAGAMAGR